MKETTDSVLVTGGAGFLGINLIRYLLQKGVRNVVSLDITEFSYPEADRVRVVQGDIRDRGVVESVVAGCRWVIHTAAALPLYSKEDIFSTEVDGTRCLLEAASRLGVERFIHISSTAVYGVPDHSPISETDDLVGVGLYGEAKIEAERLCEDHRAAGLCLTVLRPKSFVGPERLGAFELLYSWARDGKSFPIVGSGANRYQLLDVEDLCEAIYLCATLDRTTVNDAYNIGAREFRTFREDFQAVLDAAGHGKRVVAVPKWLGIMALRAMETLRLSPIYEWIYRTAGKDSVVSIEKAEKNLGYAPKFSNQDALLRNYSWFLRHQDGFESGPGLTHRKPWKHGILRVLKAFF